MPPPVTTLRHSSDGLLISLTGDMVLAHVRHLGAVLYDEWSSIPDGSSFTLDLNEVGRLDGAGIALLVEHIATLEARECELKDITGPQRATTLIDLYRQRRSEVGTGKTGGKKYATERLGRAVMAVTRRSNDLLDSIGALGRALTISVIQPASVAWRDVPLLLQRAGADGVGIVVLTNLLVGMIMGFQGVTQLRTFGADAMTPMLVTVAHLRELGPIMTAIIVAGRSGAGMAAELGTMKVAEEIDALRTMGFDPMRTLVVPRIVALMIALPVLALLGNIAGLVGGGLATVPLSSLTMNGYIDATADAITPAHFFTGMAKTPAFALAIAAIACMQGMGCRGGAASVGKATTAAVVLGILLVIIINTIFSVLWSSIGI